MGKKHLLLAFCAFTCCAYSYAESPKSMQIWLKDGQQKSFYVSDVDSVTFGIAEEQPYQELNEWTMPPVIEHPAPLKLSGNELEYVKAENQLAKSYFKKICEAKQDSNRFFCPISLNMALGLCANGASDKGAKEIANALGFKDGDELAEMNQYFNKLYLSLNAQQDSCIFSLNNAIWPLKGLTVLEPFLTSAREQYYATVRHLDFLNDPVGSKAIIDQWADTMTHGLISKLSFEPDNAITLVINNACYFKAQWMKEFDSLLTQTDTFTTFNGEKRLVKMMKNDTWKYAENDSSQIVELPYKGPYSMFLVLPKENVSVEGAIETLDETLLTQTTYPSNEGYALSLPKFDITDAMTLKQISNDLGINDMFQQFNRAISMKSYVSEIIQDSHIKLDEQGTEAAAVTSVIVVGGGTLGPKNIIKFNRPFGYVIVEKNSGMMLFMGKCTKLGEDIE